MKILKKVPDHEFRCWVSPDMEGTEFENKNKSWFHFRCHSERESMIRFNMMNLNKHTKLFNQVLVMSLYHFFKVGCVFLMVIQSEFRLRPSGNRTPLYKSYKMIE